MPITYAAISCEDILASVLVIYSKVVSHTPDCKTHMPSVDVAYALMLPNIRPLMAVIHATFKRSLIGAYLLSASK